MRTIFKCAAADRAGGSDVDGGRPPAGRARLESTMGLMADAVNDPTLRTLAYLAAAALCAAAYASARRVSAGSRASLWWLWLAIAAVLVGFAFLRETDLERTVGRHLRDIAQGRGWYPDRRPVQEFVIAVVAFGAMGAALVGTRLVRHPDWELTFAVMALIYLASFVIIRAVSLHEVDSYLYGRSWHGVRPAALGELAGTVGIGLAAALAVCGSATVGGRRVLHRLLRSP